MGMPRSQEDLMLNWRSNISMKEFKKVKKQFENQGINIFLHISHIVWVLIIQMMKLSMQ